MGQKDLNGYYAEKCHIFFLNFWVWIHQVINSPDQKIKYVAHYFVYKSHYLLTKYGTVH